MGLAICRVTPITAGCDAHAFESQHSFHEFFVTVIRVGIACSSDILSDAHSEAWNSWPAGGSPASGHEFDAPNMSVVDIFVL